MASLVALALTAVALGVNTLIAAVSARFFRIRLNTQWGWVAYSLLLIPLVLVLVSLLEGLIITAPLFASAQTLFLATFVGIPLALGITIDLLYVPPPEEYELPESTE